MQRLGFLARRLAMLTIVSFGASIVVFASMRILPGDPARAMLGMTATPEALAALRRDLGLDQPLLDQYLSWLGSALQGDLGTSIRLGQSVTSRILQSLPVTFLLGVYALAFALLLSIPASIISATRKNSAADYGSRLVALLGLSMPSFWIGLMLILLFAVSLNVLPAFGYVPPWEDPWDHVRHMILPTIALGAGYAALVYEQNRNSLIDVLAQDHIRTARASGLPERLVLLKYAMRNASIVTITVIGVQVGFLMSGAVVVESVFAIPGLGRLLVDAVTNRDYPLVQGAMIVTVGIFVVVNLAVDVIYSIIDPRIGHAHE
jgi:peptide/nickel transport system permease protein